MEDLSVGWWSVVGGLVEHMSVGRWSGVGCWWVCGALVSGSVVGIQGGQWSTCWWVGGWWSVNRWRTCWWVSGWLSVACRWSLVS